MCEGADGDAADGKVSFTKGFAASIVNSAIYDLWLTGRKRCGEPPGSPIAGYVVDVRLAVDLRWPSINHRGISLPRSVRVAAPIEFRTCLNLLPTF